MRAFHAEAVKFFTTRLWLWLGLVLVVLTGLLTFLIVNAVDDVGARFDEFAAADMAEMVTALAPLAYVIAAVLGIIALTGEYRHQTITPTFLAVPRRWVVLAAKLAFYFVIGGICGLLFTVVVAVIAFPGLNGKGYDISLGDQVVAGSFRGVILVSALFGMFGVAVGALLRNQAFAITAVVLYHFVVENILQVIPSTADVYPYLPGGAARAVMYEGVGLAVEGVDLLSASQSAFVIVVWALGLAGVGLLTTLNRDVT
jgi:ABC-2 type transport system permease protein